MLPEHHLSWGGALLPAIQTVDPQFRQQALEKYYLPKLLDEQQPIEVFDRVTRAAEGKLRPGSGESRTSKRSSIAASHRSGARSLPRIAGMPGASGHSQSSVSAAERYAPRVMTGEAARFVNLTPRGHCAGKAWLPCSNLPMMRPPSQANQLAPPGSQRFFAGPRGQVGPVGRLLDPKAVPAPAPFLK